MRRHLTSLAALVFLATVSTFAQSVLPDQFGGWTASAKGPLQPPVVYDGDHVGSMMVQRAGDALKEFGFISGEQANYSRAGNTLQVKLYKMKDASGAYGEYFYLLNQQTFQATLYQLKDARGASEQIVSTRAPGLISSNLTEHSAISSDRALVLDGNLVVEIEGRDLPRHEADLRSLIASVTTHAQHGGLPMLLQHMPHKGKIDGTDIYVLGPNVLFQLVPLSQDDWLGFSQDTEAQIAKYRVDGHEVTLVVADFPTPQLATAKLAALQKRFNVNGSKTVAEAEPLFAKRSLTLLAVAVGAHSQAEADVLLNQVNTTTEVTWNEPTFSLTEPSFPAMIVEVFVGTGVICLFAMISSVAFGGFRLAVKRFYPNKVFDRPNEIQILQLGLSSKPINAEDFYSLDQPNPS